MTLDRRSTLVFSLTFAMMAAMLIAGIPAAAQTFSVIHNFTNGPDGAYPYDALTVGPGGALYGTAVGGGTYHEGTVFKLRQVGSDWVFSPLFEFTGGSDGSQPVGGVVFGPDGALYGTTSVGGIGNNGVVFSLAPPRAATCRASSCYWNETVLHSFTGTPDGFNPGAENLVFDAARNIYGTTINGGQYGPGGGTVFELTPSGGGYTETLLYSFRGSPDGWAPFGGVALDDAGNVYGTTAAGGLPRLCSSGCGTVYQVSPSNGGWQETVLHDFDVLHGYYPNGDLIRDASGNLYGTAIASADYNEGVLFKLAPTEHGFFYSVVHQFTTDCEPYGAPTMDSAGNFFGTCLYGGNGGGWVYELTNCDQRCTVIDLHDFTYNGREGATPWGGPTLDGNGNLYGTAQVGGAGGCDRGCGVVWEIAGVGAPLRK